MPRVFTITEGLENMGAMRTGGQGSVYKGKRIGEIVTAVKILPTPIYAENNEDQNFRNFQSEVAKLKKVNEEPSPHVVTILSSGITDSGSLPFIEMEYIEGPDLEELLKPPHDPIFTIKEAIKLADQLACALAHCHRVEVRHGDIKSNNVKLNVHSGNYMLLDFGLSVMSDEQRRTSLRHAGAIEFMAPEQNDGKMLYQTDIYSYGIILFELLAGTVPFPLTDNSEISRNEVMISHMDAQLPDLLKLRLKNMPEQWPQEQRISEMQVPQWLLNIVYKCLEKDPEKRFVNGTELHEAIANRTVAAHQASSVNAVIIESENERLQTILNAKDEHLTKLKETLAKKEAELLSFKNQADFARKAVPVARPVFLVLLLLMLSLVVFAGFTLLRDKRSGHQTSALLDTTMDSTAIADSIAKADSLAKVDSAMRADSIRKAEALARASEPKTPIREISAQSEPANEDHGKGNGKAKGKGKKNKLFEVRFVKP
ncbi:MAG: serine/threonine protein kinase [Sphingobacteriaceae bacterium]|jgi:serine/threonine-protein kinase|nr:serine/threonine protein kinase [Sphingobacteriaceae bacterium]